jgi:hypothetical protein
MILLDDEQTWDELRNNAHWNLRPSCKARSKVRTSYRAACRRLQIDDTWAQYLHRAGAFDR